MANGLNAPLQGGKRKKKLRTRLMVSMLLIVLLQVAIIFVIMAVGGEFSYVKQYAYHTLKEKTETRRNYLEDELQTKAPYAQEYAEKINTRVAEILSERNATIADLRTDGELDRLIIESSVATMVDLLRRSMSNDAYLILETGALYEEGGRDAKVALYIRDLDTKTDAGYEDLLMEIGATSISRDSGIMLDTGWSLRFQPDPEDRDNYDFYYRTIEIAQENTRLDVEFLGYWSSFSQLQTGAAASMKYTVPLISEDGTVYGVLGIGLTEQNILSKLPPYDFTSETGCYVLGRDNSDDVFDIITHSGTSFTQLVGSTEQLAVSEALSDKISDFDTETNIDLAGSVQYMDLYSAHSPYHEERWALISVADRKTVLRPLTFLIQILLIATLISLAVSVVLMIVNSHRVAKPLSDAVEIMNASQKHNERLHFRASDIFEIDRMTDAITQLQINVQNFSSQVSQMIKIADIGLGTFMYDKTDDTVFVGQSLLNLMPLELRKNGDILMTREKFLESIIEEKIREEVTAALEMPHDESDGDYTKEFYTEDRNGDTVWIRLSLTYANNNARIGILQDITDTILEKKRIEFERDYDSLTGLLNRHAYYRYMDELFQDKSGLETTAFIMLDLDNLKYVNDTYGHDFGDDYIRTAAAILKQFQNYGGIVSRISGDEFNICLPGHSSKEEVREIINLVRDELLDGSCLLADGTHFKVRASMGVSWYPDDGNSFELLIKYADFAMYTIKHSTKGGIAEFDMNAYSADSLLLTGVEEMNRVLDECSVRYAFQSIVSVKTGEIYGYEALMRVQSDIFQSPLELLRTAKSGGKLYEIERMTWTRSLMDFQTQIDEGHIAENARVFINSIASTELQEDDEKAVEATHPDLLSRVVLEILESESAEKDYISRKISRMRRWGAQIALDDFGTGYNSEYALITMQPNIIKIDRSIISGCDKDISRRMIINSLVRLARTKDLLVLAEGVETEEELRTVIACGVDLLQGFYLARPMFEPQPLPQNVKELIVSLSDSRVTQRWAMGKSDQNQGRQ